MAKAKNAPPKEKPSLGGVGLMSALEGIMGEVGVKESRTYRPVPTGINVLDFYNARYFMNHESKDWELFSGMPIGKLILKIGYTGTGKSLPVTQVVQTPAGPRPIGELKVGDTAFARNGKRTRVIGVYPQGILKTFRMTFRDGTSTLCSADHLWSVQHRTAKNKEAWQTKTTAELAESGLTFAPRGYKWKIPLCEPVQYVAKDLPVDPYVLGVLLGDGSLGDGKACFACSDVDSDIADRLLAKLGENYRLTKRTSAACPQYYIADDRSRAKGGKNELAHAIRDLGLAVLSGDKFIPEMYLRSSVADRVELLRGLMDTDGTSSGNRIRFSTTSRKLADGMCELVRSLGGVAILSADDRADEGKTLEYTVRVRVTFNPFHSLRKGSGWRASSKNPPVKYIESIIEEGEDEHVCIMVEDEEHLFMTNDYIVTHNTTLCVQEALALVEPYESGTVFHFDLENAWSKERTADITGLPMDVVDKKYKRFDPVPLETIYAFVKKVINAKQEMMTDPNSEIWVEDVRTGERIPTPTVIIIDTVAALQSTQVMEEKEEMGSLLFESGAQAKANNAFAQRLTGMIGDPNITIYAVNHIRVDPGPSGGPPKAKRIQYLNMDETCPGGTGFPQYSDYFLKMVPCESLTNKADEGFAIPGKVVRCTIVKSRLSYDGRQFELVLTANGISNAWTNLHFLKQVKALKGAGAHLFIEAPDGRQTQKFAQRNWEQLYEGDEAFREIADARLEAELMALVPQPGATAAPDAVEESAE